MFFFYKNYPYAPRATLISVLGSMGALLSAVAAVLLFSCYSKNIIFIPLGILCAAAAVCSYIFLYMKLARKIAEKDGEKISGQGLNTAVCTARSILKCMMPLSLRMLLLP